ncbi:selenium metabolism protein YedF [Desulfarculus baarsii DSM 2075]|uniref:Selenium metabolism protein YedF n=1 Tax=Desulfarculus baarsii (strain ATCC 33931 / DSM 2075 / LMG 7858 / VKM B-1802 / 2st14) TaxID=644282 RepID=E1QLS0_DESB2|nr:sulfurtransferase-like selenium metabolism protein YedF [Desulfarculus baarsii]ADK86505.1 selenium metabolism protein YedF [Desulfarculus baarsii DSM 2075]
MLDCRGLACPQPVIRAKELIERTGAPSVEALVDNQAAAINVSRFLESRGYDVQVTPNGADYLISARRDPEAAAPAQPAPDSLACAPGPTRHLVLVRSDTFGRGDDALGAGLMKNFLLTLKEMGPELWRLVFVNAGVKLCVTGAPTLECLLELEAAGVSILVCGTCLNHFGLLEQKMVGQTTNMLDIVTSMQAAAKVVTV